MHPPDAKLTSVWKTEAKGQVDGVQNNFLKIVPNQKFFFFSKYNFCECVFVGYHASVYTLGLLPDIHNQ